MKTLEELKRVQAESKSRFQQACDALSHRGGTVAVTAEQRAQFEQLCEVQPLLTELPTTSSTDVARHHWIAG
jgi:hypothetical protein